MKLVNPAFSGVKNIIFDYGGVIIDLDFGRTQQAFAALGISNIYALADDEEARETFHQFEKGLIGAEPFINRVLALLPADIADEGNTVFNIVNAWNAMLGEVPTERLALLTALKENYQTYLLSNTNTLHIAAVDRYLKQAHNIDSIYPYFHQVYYSYNMGMRKPDTDIFEDLLAKENLKAEETLFIDDSLPNIETAEKLGLKVHYLPAPQQVLALFG